MEKLIRETLFEPLLTGNLKAIVPESEVVTPGGLIQTSALLTFEDDHFLFDLHFNQAVMSGELKTPKAGVFTPKDCLTIRGQINGEIAFECRDVFPPAFTCSRSRGTSVVRLRSSRMHLIAESLDKMTSSEINALLGKQAPSQPESGTLFSAHLIYHGPRLKMFDGGTEVVSKNDFLGDATCSSFDTHKFQTEEYEGALIQKGSELHLHLRSLAGSKAMLSQEDVISVVHSVNQAVGFCLGFNPWPAYREVRVDHVVIERYLSPENNLPTTYLVPISEQLWASLRSDRSSALHSLVPCIADGLRRISSAQRDKLTSLLWHMRAISLARLPQSLQMLTMCAIVDAMTKLVAGVEPDDKPATDKTWKAAGVALGISWEKWMSDVFELWGKYRHTLSHGWLWVGDVMEPQVFFADFPKLGSSFLVMVARVCGYAGPILVDPFASRILQIQDIMDEKAPRPEQDT